MQIQTNQPNKANQLGSTRRSVMLPDKEKSIFGQIVDERQKLRDGNQGSDEDENDYQSKPIIYEEDKDDFIWNARLHRPSLMSSSVLTPSRLKESSDHLKNNELVIPQFGGKQNFIECSDDQLSVFEIDQAAHYTEIQPEIPFEINLLNENQRKQRRMSTQLESVKTIENSTDVSQINNYEVKEVITTSNYKKFMKKTKFQTDVQQEITEQLTKEESDSDCSQTWISDKSYKSQNYLLQTEQTKSSLQQKVSVSQRTTSLAGVGEAFLNRLMKPQKEIQVDDITEIVSISEELYKKYAERKLKESKAMTIQMAKILTTNSKQTTLVIQRVLVGPKLMKQTSESFVKRLQKGIRPTCITLSNYSVIFGTSSGIIFAYDKDTEKFHSLYREEGQEYKDNCVTCIDVHPLRPEYVVFGHQKGQIVLLDLTKLPKKAENLKLIKDHHKSAVVSVKFCDWIKERPLEEDKTNWMFCSCDTDGRVIISKVSSIAFRILSVDKMVIIDNQKRNPSIFQVISSRFFDKRHPKDQLNDDATIIALGSVDEVIIEVIEKERSQLLFRLTRPKFYPSDNLNTIVPFPNTLPCISWGYGRTPNFQDQTYQLLAVAWGPLIQIICMLDIGATSKQKFVLDGYYFVAPATEFKLEGQDPQIQSLHFLDESVLVVTLQTLDIRVLYTKQFIGRHFEQPNPAIPISNYATFDTRRKVVKIGAPLSKEQQEIELERRTYLEEPLLKSQFGPISSQTISVCDGRVVILSNSASIFKLQHLTWEETLGRIDPQLIQERNNWIDIFAKVLEIYLGKIKGLRNVPDDDRLRQYLMRGQIKQKITEILEVVILFWRMKASTDLKQGRPKDQVSQELNRNLSLLMRIIIELSVEIDEADFLFTDVYQRFKDVHCGEMFSTEVKPYILSGLFSDWQAPEHVLNFHILQHHQTMFLEASHGQNTSPTSGIMDTKQISSAENFERVIISLRFDSCSQMNIEETIEFCKKYKLSTAALHLCINTMGQKGPLQSLKLLKDFYLEALRDESESRATTIAEIKSLANIPANQPERIPLERSSIFIGFKLLWAIRMFIDGRKFPKGKFEKDDWSNIVHSIFNHITQPDFMNTLCNIDSSAFFQILIIPFDSSSTQYNFILKPQVYNKGVIITHEKLLNNLSNICTLLPKGHQIRQNYLCFLANIAESQFLTQDRLYFYGVTLELLENTEQLVQFNKKLLNSSNQTFFRTLSQKVKLAPAEHQANILSEEQLTKLMKKSEILTPENINELTQAVESTQFHSLKLIMYEKQEDYFNCLQMQLSNSNQMISDLSTNQSENIQQCCFTWIIKVYFMLQNRVKEKDSISANNDKFNQFQRQILDSTVRLIEIDPHKTVGLCEAIFKADHELMINRLCENPQSQYIYIKKLIELKGDQIKKCIKAFTLQKQLHLESQVATWTKILSLHMRLTSKIEPDQVLPLVKLIARDNWYPLEECLQVCKSGGHIEASALLSEEIGNYAESVRLQLEILKSNLNISNLRKELYFISTHQNVGKDRLKNITLFESVFKKIDRICQQHPEETLKQNDICWQQILETISELLNNNLLKKKQYCKRFLLERFQSSCRYLLGHVTFEHIIQNYLKTQPMIRYRNLHALVSEVFLDRKSETDMCLNADSLVKLECKKTEESFILNIQSGLSFRSLKCHLCFKHIQQGSRQDKIVVFDCYNLSKQRFNHSFHLKCVNQWLTTENEKNKKASSDLKLRCAVCHNCNYEVDYKPNQYQKAFSTKSQIQSDNNNTQEQQQQENQNAKVETDRLINTKSSPDDKQKQQQQVDFQLSWRSQMQKQKEKQKHEKLKKMKMFEATINESVLKRFEF